MKRNYFSILFFIKKTKLLKNGEAPICLRITVNGQRAEVQIKRSVDIGKWNVAKECAIGKEAKLMELNHYLETVRTKILRIHRELEQDDKPITAHILMKHFRGENEPVRMLLEVFKEHNKKCRELLGREYVLGTILRYERTVTYLSEFMKEKYNISDIPMKNLTPAFITDFEHFVKIRKNCAQNAAVKYLKNLKRIVLQALANKWTDTDPFHGIRFHQTKTNRTFLTEEELEVLIKKDFDLPRMELARDIFIFCCFTGLAFTDVKNLKPEHIICDNKGEQWIYKAREKTDNMCNIPLLDVPLKLIEKYKNHPECVQKRTIFPVPSNQRMNSYLKEIADCCGINKNLTTHIARHSFACVALANKVSLDSIAKMLGHTDLRTTKIYARIQDRTIAEEMQSLKGKFAV